MLSDIKKNSRVSSVGLVFVGIEVVLHPSLILLLHPKNEFNSLKETKRNDYFVTHHSKSSRVKDFFGRVLVFFSKSHSPLVIKILPYINN